MEEFDLPDIEAVEPTDEQNQREREQLRLDMQRQEEDDERRWEGIEFTGRSPDSARAKKCSEERGEYVKQRDLWVERVVGPIHSKKKSRKDRERLEMESG